MSSRAVRKALKQKELAAKLKPPNPEKSEEHEDEGEDDEQEEPLSTKRTNLFAMLGGNDEEDEGEDDEENGPEQEEKKPTPVRPSASGLKKSKKKKKKGKGKSAIISASASISTNAPGIGAPTLHSGEREEDEIDRALRALKVKGTIPSATDSSGMGAHVDDHIQLQEFLRVESRNLDAQQEMRRLFGRAVVSTQADSDAPRRHQHGPPGRRQARTTAGRTSLTLRRNVFVPPKPTWPSAASGGLGMEMIEKADALEFSFVHSKHYQDVQRQFMMCVLSMDPQRLVTLLQHNPYHISTLLQVSDIAASERDNTVAGELLERALFSFGRSTHSKFSDAMGRGTARLDFRKFENREFWLAVWRYINNLGLRGTWRTAEAYGRLLFALDPVNDPYQVILLLDVLCLKAHQPKHLLSLHGSLNSRLSHLPNIAYSVSLAYLQLTQGTLAREYLAKAITRFPWVLTRLVQELSIDVDLPPALWGQMVPEGDRYQSILCELYIHRSKDLWNLQDAKSMIAGVAATIHNLPKYRSIPNPNATIREDWNNADEVMDGIDINLARHVILSEIPTVTSLVPQKWKESLHSVYDPLPPRSNIITYEFERLAMEALDIESGERGGDSREAEGLLEREREVHPFEELLRFVMPMIAPGGELDIAQQDLEGTSPSVQAIPTESLAPGGWPETEETRQQERQQDMQEQQQEQEQRLRRLRLRPPSEAHWHQLAAVMGVERTQRVRDLVELRMPRRQGNGPFAAAVNATPDPSEGENQQQQGIRQGGVTNEIINMVDATYGDGDMNESPVWGMQAVWEDEIDDWDDEETASPGDDESPDDTL